MAGEPGARVQRQDATRNRAAILDAALRLSERVGICMSVQDVARDAGVAVGTVYRHWPTKHDLLRSVLVERLDRLAADAEVADSLVGFLDAVTETCVRDRTLLQLLDAASTAGSPPAGTDETAVQDRFDTALAHLIDRARRHRQLRHAVQPRDVRVYLVGLRAALASPDPDASRRYHAIYRSGLFQPGTDERAG